MLKFIARSRYNEPRRWYPPAQQYQRQAQTVQERQEPTYARRSTWLMPHVAIRATQDAPARSQARREGRHPRVRMRIHMI